MEIAMTSQFDDVNKDTTEIEYAPKFSWEKAADDEEKNKFEPPSRDQPELSGNTD